MKRAISILLTASLLATLLAGCKDTAPGRDGYVTRGEWVAMLGETFGLDDPLSDAPVYTDVTASDPIFPYVQSAAEWAVLSVYPEDTLAPNKLVTGREVAATAAFAAGFHGGDVDGAVTYAQQYGIVAGALGERVTAEECAAILEAAQAVYLENPGEDKLVAVFAEGVVDLRELGPEWISVGGDRLTVYTAVTFDGSTATLTVNGQPRKIAVGSVVLVAAPGDFPVDTALKITAIAEENGQVVFTTAQPDFSEIYDELDIHSTVSMETDGYVVWEEGVTATETVSSELSATGRSYHVELLVNEPLELTPKSDEDDHLEKRWSFWFGRGASLKWTGKNSPMLGNGPEARLLKGSNFVYTDTPSLTDFAGQPASWHKPLQVEKKYEKSSDTSYTLSGDIAFSLEATPEIEYHKLLDLNIWPKTASLTVKSSASANIKFEGVLEEDLKLATAYIPLGATGVMVEAGLYLYVTATGSIQVKLVLEDTTRVTWNDEAGFEKVSAPFSRSSEVTGAIDIATGVGLSAKLTALGYSFVGADVRIGGDLEAKGELVGECREEVAGGAATRHYTEAIRLTSTLYLPIVTLTVTGPDYLSDWFGWEKSWDIIGKDKAKQIPLVAADWVIWEAVTTVENGVETVVSEGATAQAVDLSAYAGMYSSFGEWDEQVESSLVLQDDGTFYGTTGYSGFSYPLAGSWGEPMSVTDNEDGSITCVISDEMDTIYTENDDYYNTGNAVSYTIYPPGVPAPDCPSQEYDGTTRIYYLYIDGGAEYHWYYLMG